MYGSDNYTKLGCKPSFKIHAQILTNNCLALTWRTQWHVLLLGKFGNDTLCKEVGSNI